jgi:hypothetical protein
MTLHRAFAVLVLMAGVSGCGISAPQATSHDKTPSDSAPCAEIQATLFPLSAGHPSFKPPALSQAQIDQHLQAAATLAEQARNKELIAEGHGLASALTSHNLPNRGTYLGQLMRTCTLIGLFKLPE